MKCGKVGRTVHVSVGLMDVQQLQPAIHLGHAAGTCIWGHVPWCMAKCSLFLVTGHMFLLLGDMHLDIEPAVSFGNMSPCVWIVFWVIGFVDQ